MGRNPGADAPDNTRRKAFTLVELLVVIAIISILAGLLLPALESAQRQALKVTCANNQRQIYFCHGLYASDWDDYLVPYYVPGGNTDSGDPYKENSSAITFGIAEESKALYDDYDPGGGSFICPDTPAEGLEFNGTVTVAEDGWPPTAWNYNWAAPGGATYTHRVHTMRYAFFGGRMNIFSGRASNYWGHYNARSTPIRISDRRKMFHTEGPQSEQATTLTPLAACLYWTGYSDWSFRAIAHREEGLNALQPDGSVVWKIFTGAICDYTGDPEIVKFTRNYTGVGPMATPPWQGGYGDYGY